ncbi:hypothetical protein TRIUR3_04123 [Triticum urartu]|uniref:Uncharacterized protein n=1 Tax=Triticum urartu TaxID=4572 RepID=M7ZMM9_TRIUA|nr:hypothetical protein TRIUR3_04123 [Triticum urartu]
MKLVQDNRAGTSMFYFVKMKQVQDNRAGTSMFYPVLPDSMYDLPAPLVPRFTTAKKYNRNYRARRAARRSVFQAKGFVFFEGELENLFQPRAKGQPFELSEGDLELLFHEEFTFNVVSHHEFLSSLEYIEFAGQVFNISVNREFQGKICWEGCFFQFNNTNSVSLS